MSKLLSQSLVDAIVNYSYDDDSFRTIKDMLVSELGENWATDVYEGFEGLAPEVEKAATENMEQIVNYDGALAAWEEGHALLDNKDKVTAEYVRERMPAIEYWLSFFEEGTEDLIASLKELAEGNDALSVTSGVQEQSEAEMPPREAIATIETSVEEAPEASATPFQTEEAEEVKPKEVSNFQAKDEEGIQEPAISETPTMPDDALMPEKSVADVSPSGGEEASYVSPEDMIAQFQNPEVMAEAKTDETAGKNQEMQGDNLEYLPVEVPINPPDPEALTIEEITGVPIGTTGKDPSGLKAYPLEKPLDSSSIEEWEWYLNRFLRLNDYYDQTLSRTSARCVAMGGLSIYEYPYFFYILDLLQELIEMGRSLIAKPAVHAIIEERIPRGVKGLESIINEYEKDFNDNAPPEMLEQYMDIKKIKATLGTLAADIIEKNIGPAPDGFVSEEEPSVPLDF